MNSEVSRNLYTHLERTTHELDVSALWKPLFYTCLSSFLEQKFKGLQIIKHTENILRDFYTQRDPCQSEEGEGM